MKKFVIGFILGAMIFGSGIVFAEEVLKIVRNPYPVLINGVITEVDGYNIDGSTYLKLRDFEKAGLGVNWNNEKRQIEITSVEANNDIMESEETSKGEMTVTEKITQTPDGITQIDTWEGKQYIAYIYVRNKIKEKGYDFLQPIGVDKWQVVKGDSIIIDDVPVTQVFGRTAVEVDYYINTILPLIK